MNKQKFSMPPQRPIHHNILRYLLFGLLIIKIAIHRATSICVWIVGWIYSWAAGLMLFIEPTELFQIDMIYHKEAIMLSMGFNYLLGILMILLGFYSAFKLFKYIQNDLFHLDESLALHILNVQNGSSQILRRFGVQPYYGSEIIFPETGEPFASFDSLLVEDMDIEDNEHLSIFEVSNSNIKSLQLSN